MPTKFKECAGSIAIPLRKLSDWLVNLSPTSKTLYRATTPSIGDEEKSITLRRQDRKVLSWKGEFFFWPKQRNQASSRGLFSN